MWATRQYYSEGETMDWIRQWVLQIAVIIILGAICDIIMIEGEVKKYIKPIMGFVLVFTIIRPVTALSEEKLKIDIFQDSIYSLSEISQEIDEKQQIHIVKTYEKKICTEIKKIVKQKYGFESDVVVSAEKTVGRMGYIREIKIEIYANDREFVNTESVKEYIAEKFGVDDKAMSVILRGRSEKNVF